MLSSEATAKNSRGGKTSGLVGSAHPHPTSAHPTFAPGSIGCATSQRGCTSIDRRSGLASIDQVSEHERLLVPFLAARTILQALLVAADFVANLVRELTVVHQPGELVEDLAPF